MTGPFTDFSPDAFDRLGVATNPRWSALVRLGVGVSGIAGIHSPVVRQPRLLVPIDVQALYVPAGGDEAMARIPLAMRTDADGPTGLLEPGAPRQRGVHLHWAMPDALTRGKRSDAGPSFPALPDRWAVLRLLAPGSGGPVQIRGWVIEAETARVIPLESWPTVDATTPSHGPVVTSTDLTAASGGSLLWTGCYDASFGRFGLHDPLDDLPDGAADTIADKSAAYLVAGWWSDPRLDPLDIAHTTKALAHRLAELCWSATPGATGGDADNRWRFVREAARRSLGVNSPTRYDNAARATATFARAAAGPTARYSDEFNPAASLLAEGVSRAVSGEVTWPRATLVHGTVVGVPITGAVSADHRPATTELQAAIGVHLDDAAAAFAADGMGLVAPDERRNLERLLAAFTTQLLNRTGSPDGMADIEQAEHESGFAARSMGTAGTDYVRRDAGSAGVGAGRKARSATAPVSGLGSGPNAHVVFATTKMMLLDASLSVVREHIRKRPAASTATTEPSAAAVEAVVRSAPRAHRALDPQAAVRGAAPSYRHGGDGRLSTDGRLRCRWPSEVVKQVQHVVTGSDVLPALPTSALPDEVLGLAREALLLNPYLTDWLAGVAESKKNAPRGAAHQRLVGEALLRFGPTAVYGAAVGSMVKARVNPALSAHAGILHSAIEEQLTRSSLVEGVLPDPVGVTAWAQPWLPLLADWEVEVVSSDRLDAWSLGEADSEPADAVEPQLTTRIVRGRSVLTTGAADHLAAAVDEALKEEDALDKAGPGEIAEADEARLAALAAVVRNLDLVSFTLQGLRDRLLGLVDVPGTEIDPGTAVDPALLLSGTLKMRRLRLIDAFGRGLEVPLDVVGVPQREKVEPSIMRLRPRLAVDARWWLRLVDPAADGIDAAEGTVDQRPDASGVNPVAGFLLPDHIDEALEVFDSAGQPLGQLSHEPVGGGVSWEIAPGRAGPPDAGPLLDLTPAQASLGRFAAGLIAADAQARNGKALPVDRESALSALLRAIDTVLWTVDPLAAMGTEHIAGLVGRPIAVVAATLRLDLQPDPRRIDLTDAAVAAAWQSMVARSADRAIRVRLGALTRADDGLLAYFVDDDYSRVRLVDKALVGAAVESGRNRGYQSRIDLAPDFPAAAALDHPYLLADDEVLVRPGQTVRLTLLLHPAGKVHLTSGVLPRKAIALARDWVAPGLAAMAPSVRVGPVLVDPAKLRLPKVASLGASQAFTRRDTPGSWKDDPILAATQSALLPDLPAEVQEGYIRVMPAPAGPTS
ncbi:MAG: hypothetical protein ABIS03_00595 [Gemmatimonadaceae bacterium]